MVNMHLSAFLHPVAQILPDHSGAMANILICDDDRFIRLTLSDMLTREGYSVDTVTRMPEAIRKLMESQYDLLILDVHIEGIEGIHPVSVIRSMDSKIPVIALAETESLETQRNAQTEGHISHYLVKPIDKERLKAAIESALKDRVSPPRA